jgi:hypothetical protein
LIVAGRQGRDVTGGTLGGKLRRIDGGDGIRIPTPDFVLLEL